MSDTTIITRDEAFERGLKRYFTGVQCRQGHIAERYTSTTGCIACLRRTLPRQGADPTRLRFLPPGPWFFGMAEGPQCTSIEAEATLRYMQANGWHLAALKQLRADPKLMARYDHERTMQEKFAEGR